MLWHCHVCTGTLLLLWDASGSGAWLWKAQLWCQWLWSLALGRLGVVSPLLPCFLCPEPAVGHWALGAGLCTCTSVFPISPHTDGQNRKQTSKIRSKISFGTLNTEFFHSGCQKKPIFVALSLAPLYASIASTYLIFIFFLRFISMQECTSVQFRFHGITLTDCVLKCNIAIFFCCRTLSPNNFIAGHSTVSSKCQPINMSVPATVFIKYSLWHYRKEMWNIPSALISLILACLCQHNGTSSLPWHYEPSCVILWP